MNRSTTSRLVRGTLVTWIRLILTILAQLLTTPVYLSFWSLETYGAWLAIITAVSVLQIPGINHQNYVGNELLRLRHIDHTRYTATLRSAIGIGVILGALELSAAIGFGLLGSVKAFGLSTGIALDGQIQHAFLLMALPGALVWNWGGVWVRAASAEGLYERGAWWGVADGLVKVFAPLLVLPLDAGPVAAAATLSAASILLYTVSTRDLARSAGRALRKTGNFSWKIGFQNCLRAQALGIKAIFELARQQGTRLILAPLAGASDMAAFSTMRTGSNVALQGLNSITNPLMPELMRFLAQRDQVKMEAGFASIWGIVLIVMCPAVIVLQIVAPEIFRIWTLGKVPFDPLLFATLSGGVLVFGLSQPALAVVVGNNLIRPQLIISIFSGSIAIACMFYLLPKVGILGAGVSLLIAEVVAVALATLFANIWLHGTGLRWPWVSFAWNTLAVILAITGMSLVAILPHLTLIIATPIIAGLILLALLYWAALPTKIRRIVRDKATILLQRTLAKT